MSELWRYGRGAPLWVAALVFAGCAPVAARSTAPSAAPLLGPAPTQQVGPDSVTVLRGGGATFEQLRLLIAEARVSVHVEVYEFDHPELVDAVRRAHDRGVDVRVIDDPSEAHSAATSEGLRGMGVTVIDYPVRRMMIDHVKLLVVDASVAVVGGINWGTASPANHDYDALIRGPAVHNLDRVFDRDLVTCGVSATVAAPVLDTGVIVASTLPTADIRPLALELIDAAAHSLRLELFVLTDTGIVHALEAAHRRGVHVRLLLDPSQHSSDASFQSLQAAGVPVRWYRSRGELLHAKAVVADSESVLFGSANWSGGGFARNHELDIEMLRAPVIARQILDQMALDWAASA